MTAMMTPVQTNAIMNIPYNTEVENIMDSKPTRKQTRLRNYDYSQNGAYFVTICTKDRNPILWNASVGAITNRPPVKMSLSKSGRIAEQGIQNIARHYPGITLENYVVMPNHVHLLLLFQQYDSGTNGRLVIAPTTLSNVIRQMKAYVTKSLGENIWQKSFHEHIVRNRAELQTIWQYIDENPLKWQLDCYFTP